jgi:hypothetical protein
MSCHVLKMKDQGCSDVFVVLGTSYSLQEDWVEGNVLFYEVVRRPSLFAK